MRVGLSGCRTIGLSDYRAVGLSGCRTIGPSGYKAVTVQTVPKLKQFRFLARLNNPASQVLMTRDWILYIFCVSKHRIRPFVININKLINEIKGV